MAGSDKIKCACGCGENVKIWKTHRGHAKFIKGHNAKFIIKTKEIVQKWLISRKNNNLPWHTEDTRKRIGEQFKGKQLSLQHRTNISIALTKRKKSPEHCESIRQAKIGIPRSSYVIEKMKYTRKNNGLPWVSDKTREKQRLNKIKNLEYCYTHGLPFVGTIGTYETQILDSIQKCIEPYEIIRQYKVAGYFLDGYCPQLNLAFEVDEKQHKQKRIRFNDIYRERNIKNKLNCNFIRIDISNIKNK